MGLVADVMSYLGSLSPEIMDGSTGWPAVRRAVTDDTDQLIVFTEDGGFDPETPSPMGTVGDSALMEPAFQVRVRGEPWEADDALDKAIEIRDALHGLMRADMGSTHYMRIKAQTPEPIFLGYDERARPEFTQSFRALRAVVATS